MKVTEKTLRNIMKYTSNKCIHYYKHTWKMSEEASKEVRRIGIIQLTTLLKSTRILRLMIYWET